MDAYVRHSLLAAILSCLLLMGCRGPDTSIELLESELRCMEDQLYEMDRQLGIQCAQLDSCRRYNASLQQQLAATEHRPTEAQPTPEPAEPPKSAPKTDEPSFDDADLTIPKIEYGPSETTPEPSQSDPDAPNSDSQPKSIVKEKLDDVTRGDRVDSEVDRIVLNSRLTGGYNIDGRPGDDGLLVVIEPQNTAGQYLPLPGDVSVTALDPARSGLTARIARWEFDAAETTAMMKQSLLGRGIHLQLPWPDKPPSVSQLKVQVSYRSLEGQSHDAERDVRLHQGFSRERAAPVAGGRQPSPARLVPWSPTRKPNLARQLWADGVLEPPSAPVELEKKSPPRAVVTRPQLTPRAVRRQRLASPRRTLWNPFR